MKERSVMIIVNQNFQDASKTVQDLSLAINVSQQVKLPHVLYKCENLLHHVTVTQQ